MKSNVLIFIFLYYGVNEVFASEFPWQIIIIPSNRFEIYFIRLVPLCISHTWTQFLWRLIPIVYEFSGLSQNFCGISGDSEIFIYFFFVLLDNEMRNNGKQCFICLPVCFSKYTLLAQFPHILCWKYITVALEKHFHFAKKDVNWS